MTTQPDSKSIEYAAYIMAGSVVVTLGFGIWWASGGPSVATDQRYSISSGRTAEGARAGRDDSAWFSQVVSPAPDPPAKDVKVREPAPKAPPQPRSSSLPALIRPPPIRQARPLMEDERLNRLSEAASVTLPSTGPIVQTSLPPEEPASEPAVLAQPPPDAPHADASGSETAVPPPHRAEGRASGMGGAGSVPQ